MRKINCISNKLWRSIVCYILIFLAVILTPLLAQPIAKLFDWATLSWSQEGQLRPFFVELFTAILWLLEWAGFLFLDKYLKKRMANRQENSETTNIAQEPMQEVAVGEAEKAEKKEGKEKKKKKTISQKKPLLPLRNVAILFFIAAACIVVVTIQIGLKVKPFYELGDKTTYTKMLIKGGEVVRNLVKGIWIVSILKLALSMMEELVEQGKIKGNYASIIQWVSVCVLTVIFGIFDIFVFANPFVWTYILFYVAFTAVYFFTEQASVKSYLLICFIYIF